MTDLYARGHALHIVRSTLVGDHTKRLQCKDCYQVGTIGNFLSWPNCSGPAVLIDLWLGAVTVAIPVRIAGLPEMGTAPEAEASGAVVVASNACTAGIEDGTPEE